MIWGSARSFKGVSNDARFGVGSPCPQGSLSSSERVGGVPLPERDLSCLPGQPAPTENFDSLLIITSFNVNI